jgi:uncharacterized membrane protein
MKAVVMTGVFLGIGLMGALDEIVFHQMLQWHNFYVGTTQYWRIFSDGAFHVFTATVLFLGAMRLWAQRRRVSTVVSGRPLWAGLLMGLGGFQLFDGIVNHKILQLHPVREGVEEIWPYDLAWNIPAAAILLAGWLLWRSLRAEDAVAPGPVDDAAVERGAALRRR